MEKKEFISDFDYNNSSKACPTCYKEGKKIDSRINGRDLSEIEAKEIPHFLKVFDI